MYSVLENGKDSFLKSLKTGVCRSDKALDCIYFEIFTFYALFSKLTLFHPYQIHRVNDNDIIFFFGFLHITCIT